MVDLNPQQFMTAGDIVAGYRPNDRLPKDKTDAAVWARKLKASKAGSDMVLGLDPVRTGSLHDHIRERGITRPVILQHPAPEGQQPAVLDGHNRIAVQHDLDPAKPVPVRYAKDMAEARKIRDAAKTGRRRG